MKWILLFLVSNVALAADSLLQNYTLEGEKFASEQLNKHNQEKEAKELIQNIELLKKTEAFKSGMEYARTYKPQELTANETAKDLPTVNGINLDNLLYRYKNMEAPKTTGLLAFISFSIPPQNLKQIADQVKKAGGKLVIRGLVDGSMKKTIVEVNKIGNAIIHPKLFQEFKVTEVPAFIVMNTEKGYDKIVGNVSLDYALNQFKKEGNLKELAAIYLDKLESKK